MTAEVDADRRALVDRMTVAMLEELRANAVKGGWAKDDPQRHEWELWYHLLKLVVANRLGIKGAIREYAADVANHAAMLADITGALALEPRTADDDHGEDDVYDTVGSEELRIFTDSLMDLLEPFLLQQKVGLEPNV